MLAIILTIVHVIVCLFLMIVVLLQSGKAADLAGAFGGMGSQTTFGPRGSATVLSKATTIAAALFMVTSLSLAILGTRGAAGSSSILDRTHTRPVSTPVRPATPPIRMSTSPVGRGPGSTSTAPVPVPPPQNQPAPAKK